MVRHVNGTPLHQAAVGATQATRVLLSHQLSACACDSTSSTIKDSPKSWVVLLYKWLKKDYLQSIDHCFWNKKLHHFLWLNGLNLVKKKSSKSMFKGLRTWKNDPIFYNDRVITLTFHRRIRKYPLFFKAIFFGGIPTVICLQAVQTPIETILHHLKWMKVKQKS